MGSSVPQAAPERVIPTLVLTAAFIAAMYFVVRPAARWFAVHRDGEGRDTMAVVFVALLLAALASESIGIHALFGAFLLGAVIPHDSPLARHVSDRLKDVVLILLLPAFFAFTGMRTQIGLVSSAADWLTCGLIILVASLGKFGGCAVAARATGLGGSQAASLGILMNTRGLMGAPRRGAANARAPLPAGAKRGRPPGGGARPANARDDSTGEDQPTLSGIRAPGDSSSHERREKRRSPEPAPLWTDADLYTLGRPRHGSTYRRKALQPLRQRLAPDRVLVPCRPLPT